MLGRFIALKFKVFNKSHKRISIDILPVKEIRYCLYPPSQAFIIYVPCRCSSSTARNASRVFNPASSIPRHFGIIADMEGERWI